MDALGTHLLLDLQDCDADLLDDLDHIREVVTRAAGAGAAVASSSSVPEQATAAIAIKRRRSLDSHVKKATERSACARGLRS